MRRRCCKRWQHQRDEARKSGLPSEVSQVFQSGLTSTVCSWVFAAPAPFSYWFFTPDSCSAFNEHFSPHLSKVSYPHLHFPCKQWLHIRLILLVCNFSSIPSSTLPVFLSNSNYNYTPSGISSYPTPRKLSLFLPCAALGWSISTGSSLENLCVIPSKNHSSEPS